MLSPLRSVRALAAVVALWAGAAAAATGAPDERADAFDGDEPRLVARLWLDPAPGARWRVGVELVPDRGWHVYWRHPGDTGLAPRIDWRLAGGSVGAPAWPTPQVFVDAGLDLVSYGYARPVLLAAEAQAPAAGGALEVDVEALVCAQLCLPGTFRLAARLPPREQARSEPAARARFDTEALRVPGTAAERGVQARLETRRAASPAELRATLVVDACPRGADCDVVPAHADAPGLIPDASSGIRWRAGPARPHAGSPGRFSIDLVGSGSGAGARLAGVVPLRGAGGRDLSVEIALDAAPAAAARIPWLRAVALGFLGGLVLNAMPCVLPVLAIKLAALASLARASRRTHLAHAAAYAAGIAVSMLALAALVAGLRAAGAAVGWGFQLQQPAFLLAMSCLLVAFALNLFGVFEIAIDTGWLGALGADARGAVRSFADGGLATLLATPCSAPFLGTAVGFAFASPAPLIAVIFLSIGLGLAAPFLLAAAFPGWARHLPHAGAWMGELRAALGFALLGAALWLLWLLGRVGPPDAIAAALALLLALAAVAWALGAAQRRGRPLRAGVLLALLGALSIGGIDRVRVRADGPAIPIARPFAPAALRASLDAGRPVFAYFTADWCLTCKLNETRVLDEPEVARELERLGYDVYRADWTRRDEPIRAALAELGRAGVPAYALYRPGEAPRLLPELLSLEGLLEALRETADP